MAATGASTTPTATASATGPIEDRSKELLAVIVLFLALTWATFPLRLWVRVKMLKSFGIDDALTAFTMVCQSHDKTVRVLCVQVVSEAHDSSFESKKADGVPLVFVQRLRSSGDLCHTLRSRKAQQGLESARHHPGTQGEQTGAEMQAGVPTANVSRVGTSRRHSTLFPAFSLKWPLGCSCCESPMRSRIA